MRWQSETNYHNSRNYEEVPVPGALVSQARLTVAYVVDSVRRGLKRLVAPTPVQRPKRVPVMTANPRGFTTLGAMADREPIRQQTRCAFPETERGASGRITNPASRNWLLQVNDPANDASPHTGSM